MIYLPFKNVDENNIWRHYIAEDVIQIVSTEIVLLRNLALLESQFREIIMTRNTYWLCSIHINSELAIYVAIFQIQDIKKQ